jgi:hypothetical protein
MPFLSIRPTRLLALAACLLTAATLPAQGGQAAPESAGTLVYRGDTFTQRTPAGAPLYRYERRVLVTPKGLDASRIVQLRQYAFGTFQVLLAHVGQRQLSGGAVDHRRSKVQHPGRPRKAAFGNDLGENTLEFFTAPESLWSANTE